jgi:putative lipoic acid-binding regulatory protein
MTPLGGERGNDGMTVFSATTGQRRERLGDDITTWLQAHPERVPMNTVVRQSSDSRFHCLSILIFWRVARAS